MFIITGKASVTSKPTKGAFNHPATRQDLKTFCVRRTARHFQLPAKVLFDPGGNIFISAICPNQFETTPTIIKTVLDPFKQFCQQQFPAVPIGNTGPMDQNQQEQTQCVYNDMSFPSRHLFVDIHATFPPSEVLTL